MNEMFFVYLEPNIFNLCTYEVSQALSDLELCITTFTCLCNFKCKMGGLEPAINGCLTLDKLYNLWILLLYQFR